MPHSLEVSNMNMPQMQALPIDTKGKNWFKQVWMFFVSPQEWVVTEDWFVTLPNGIEVCIPKGFVCDGASTPRLLWGILNPTGVLLVPGLVHDFGYRYNYLWRVYRSRNGLIVAMRRMGLSDDQAYFDKIFLDVSLDSTGLRFVSYFSWMMLRLFGWMAWKENRKSLTPELFPGK